MTAQESRDWVKEAQNCLHKKYINFLQLKLTEMTPLVIDPALEETEAQFFMRGLEEGLFSIDDEGYVQSELLPDRPRKNTKQKVLCLFWARNGKWGLFREGVCQMATVFSLILKYGWLRAQILMEPPKAEFGNLRMGLIF